MTNVHRFNSQRSRVRLNIKNIVNDSLKSLLTEDLFLLVNDVSERAITHKLAEKLKPHVDALNVAGLSVDCEYNRNIELGNYCPKYVQILRTHRERTLRNTPACAVSEEILTEFSAYPDVIIHRRGTNTSNVLIIELKKTSSMTEDDEFDKAKLRAFTGRGNGNKYCYRHGVFIKLETRLANPRVRQITWFRGGREVS